MQKKEKTNIGERIRIKREEKKMSQTELANRMGYKSRTTIAKIESGINDVSQSNVVKFAEVLNTTIAYLMGWDEYNSNNLSINKNISFVEIIGDRITYIRHKRGMTVEELANKVGITPLQLEDMENGVNREFNSDLMKRFCEVLNVQNSYFIYMLEPVDNLGDNIKTLREINELTESEVASELSISVDQLKRYESGTENIPYDTLDKLADFFNVDVTMLLGMNFKSRANEPRFITSLRILERTKQWNEIVGLSTFSNEEMQELMNYAKFIISKRKNEQK